MLVAGANLAVNGRRLHGPERQGRGQHADHEPVQESGLPGEETLIPGENAGELRHEEPDDRDGQRAGFAANGGPKLLFRHDQQTPKLAPTRPAGRCPQQDTQYREYDNTKLGGL